MPFISSYFYSMHPDHIFVYTGERYEKIPYSSILYVHTGSQKTYLITTTGSIECHVNLNHFEALLPVAHFCRVHQSYIVGMDHVESFDHCAIQLPGYIVPIGKGFNNPLKQKIRIISAIPLHSNFYNLAVNCNGRLEKNE